MIRYFTQALRMMNHPRLRRYVLAPLMINILLFVGLTYTLFHYTGVFIERFLPSTSWLIYLSILIWPMMVITLFFIFYYGFSVIANLIAAPFLGFLSSEVEWLSTGKRPDTGLTLGQEIIELLKQECYKTFFFALRALLVLLILFMPLLNLLFPVCWFIFTAWMNYRQYLDYPMSNRMIPFKKQVDYIKGHQLELWKFGMLSNVLLMLPLINLIAMPLLTITITLYYCKHMPVAKERSKREGVIIDL